MEGVERHEFKGLEVGLRDKPGLMTRISVNSALKMDEHIRRSYGTEMLDNRLLFGETSTWVRDRALYYTTLNSECRINSGCM